MFKKSESGERARQEPVVDVPPSRRSARKAAVIGSGIAIRGEVAGGEDLEIRGRVEGEVRLGQQRLIVGEGGEVQAHIRAKAIEVYGRVDGEIHAEERAILRSSARVTGGIFAPRVVLEDGCRYQGAVQMSVESLQETHREPHGRSALENVALGSDRDSGPADTPPDPTAR